MLVFTGKFDIRLTHQKFKSGDQFKTHLRKKNTT